ncbi:MAG: glutaredoxin family protein [Desulfovibrio sp.]
MSADIKVYALSTCVHCKHAKEYLEEHHIPFDCVHVDFLSGEERTKVMDIVRKLNPSLSFPTIVIGDKVIVGFRRDEIEQAVSECEKK